MYFVRKISGVADRKLSGIFCAFFVPLQLEQF
jgi:hypothetical protein